MTQILYASDYAMLDSNVLTGGGTDDTAALQALLDQAEESGGLRLIMDGAALVTGLRVYPNTTIECLDTSCGFFLRDGSNDAILKNAHWDLEEIRDNNITLIGGTYNHNCRGQQHDVEIPPEYQKPVLRKVITDKWPVNIPAGKNLPGYWKKPRSWARARARR